MDAAFRKAHWRGGAGAGIIAGAVAGMMMAMFSMIGDATYAKRGFFTPMYILASPFLKAARTAFGVSTSAAKAGNQFHFFAGPALLGAGIHMMNSMVIGMIFGVILIAIFAYLSKSRGLRRREALLTGIVAGMVYGGVVLAAMEGVVNILPHLFGTTFQLAAHIGPEIGWSTWVLSHLIFGMVLGLLPALWAKSLVGSEGLPRRESWRPLAHGA
jgi:hypothetical protein